MKRALETVNGALRLHQVVAVVGSRGSGKTYLAEELESRWNASGVTCRTVDCRDVHEERDLEREMAELLGCGVDDLAVPQDDDAVLRLIVDSAELLHDKTWFGRLQERWRALLTRPECQGRIAVVMLGRPLFRRIAGGAGSPLLNIGQTVLVPPLSVEETVSVFGLTEEQARLVHAKTGGHFELSRKFSDSVLAHGRAREACDDFAVNHDKYILRILEDQTLDAQELLRHMLDGGSANQKVLIEKYCGGNFIQGLETLDDLEAAGLVERRSDGTCLVNSRVWTHVPGVADVLHSGKASLPLEPSENYGELSAELFVIENRLRQLVVETLSRVDQFWWTTRVPPELSATAEVRRRCEIEVIGPPPANLHAVAYLSLGELVDIVKKSHNWNGLLSVEIPLSKAAFVTAMDDLKAIRNQVAHSRSPGPIALRHLRIIEQKLDLVAADDQ